MTISAFQVFQRNPEIIASEIDNETVMMDKDFETYFGLQAIGTEVWKLLEQPISIQQIAEQFIQHYDVSLERCIADLTPLMADFLENEMVVAV